MPNQSFSKWLITTIAVLLVNSVFAQWNPDHSIVSNANTYYYSYAQIPDKLVELFPSVIGGSTSGLTYQWQQSDRPLDGFTNITGATSDEYIFTTVLSNTKYFRRVTSDISTSQYVYSNSIKIEIGSVLHDDHNYVRVHSVLVPGVTSWQAVDALPIGSKMESTIYYDGLGRKIQQVSRGVATPETGSSTWGDIVRFAFYDQFGKTTKNHLPYSTLLQPGLYKTDPELAQGNYYNTKYGETNPFSEVVEYDNSPLARARRVKSAGTSWAASNGVETRYDFNSNSDYVVHWLYNDYSTPYTLPRYYGYYGEGELYKNTSIDENGKSTVEFTDKGGKPVLKKVQVDDYGGWACSYYVYDEFGRLRYTIEPEAVKWLEGNFWNFSYIPDALEKLCFSYMYDEKGRTIGKRNPEAKELVMLYDKRDRVVLTQDGNQRSKYAPAAHQEWTATLYDALDRPLITTLYKTDKTVNTLQADVDAAGSNAYINTTTLGQAVADLVVDTRDVSVNNYSAINSITFVSNGTTVFESTTNDAFVAEINPTASTPPTIVGNTVNGMFIPQTDLNNAAVCTILKYSFYDGYTFPNAHGFDNAFNNTQAYPTNGDIIPAIAKTTRTLGFSTGSKTRILNTNVFINSTAYYNEDARPVQMIADNIKDGKDVTTQQYHFDGRLLSSYNKHTAVGTGFGGYGTLTKYIFDQIGRTNEVWKTFGTNAPLRVSSCIYDDMGSTKSKILAPDYNNTTTGKQGMETLDFSYNLHGNLTGINKDFALKNIGYNKWGNYFGLYIGYDNKDNAFSAANLTGKITGVLWNTQGDDAQRRYDYTYDNAGRLAQANFNQKDNPSSAWVNNKLDFSTFGTDAWGNITYDLNGNMLSMVNRGVVIGGSSPVHIDNLEYIYFANSNKLQNVNDYSDAGTANGKQGDFKDGTNSADDYEYDENGNTITDLNKSINNGNIKYNFLDRPETVTIQGKGIVHYVYDASGAKLQKIFTPAAGGNSSITTYINQYTYTETKLLAVTDKAVLGGGGVLQHIVFEEGRIRALQPTAQNNNNLDVLVINATLSLPDGRKGAMDYFIKDHLANTRMILTDEVHTGMGTCTMETARAGTEGAVFGTLNPYDVSTIPGQSSGTGWNNATIGQKVVKLSKTGNVVGPNTLLKVMAGDQLTSTVQYFYRNAVTNTAGGSTLASNVLTNLILNLGSSGAVSSAVHSGATGINTQLNNSIPFANIAAPDANNATGNTPKAYLTVLFFDERFNYVEGGDFRRVYDANNSNAEPLNILNLKAPKNGYAYIYVSNESDEPVYFDNLTVVHNRGRIIEEDHYYAFGLKIASISSSKLGDPLEGMLKNQYLYQGDYNEYDEDLGWNEFELRDYDPQIGRFLQQDPYDQFSSGYTGMGNDPINSVDPSGGFVFAGMNQFLTSAITTAAGAMIGGIIGGATNKWSSKSVGNGAMIGGGIGLGVSFVNWDVVGSALGNAANWVGNGLANFVQSGAGKELLFRTAEEAAKHWGKTYNDNSIYDKVEYGSTIYKFKKKNKTYYNYSTPNKKKKSGASVTPSKEPAGTTPVADIHSHGNSWGESPGVVEGDNNFSFPDKSDNISKKLDGYLTTPNGSLKKFDYKTRKITTLSTDLPSDPAFPKLRKNNIDPFKLPKNEPSILID